METEILKANVGLDISMDDFHAHFQNLRSDLSFVVKGSRTFPNTHEGFAEFLWWCEKKSSVNTSLTFTMEATGVYYECLAYYLFGQGHVVHVLLPNQVKRYGQSLGVKSKTDLLDAGVLSRMGLERSLAQWKPFSPHFQLLKSLSRERDTLIGDRTASLNRLHAYSHQGSIEQSIIKRTKYQIEFYNDQIHQIEDQITQLVESDPALHKRLSYLQSIKGVGLITAVTVVAETNGFSTFTNIKQLTSYAGMDVRIKESGKWKGRSKMSKCGNRYIRKALYWPAFSKIKHDKKTQEFYERLNSCKGIKMVAAVAVQRKLLGLMYTLWKKQEMFNPYA